MDKVGMTHSAAMDGELAALHALAPMGYSFGLHIRFASPLISKSTYPTAWVEIYNGHSYYLRDPLVFWGIGVEGVTRWSSIPLPDPFGVMRKAAKHGLKFGAVASCGPITSRSIVAMARADREFEDADLEQLREITRRMHFVSKPPSELTKAQVEALRCVANGDRHTAAAFQLGITESAFKARLQSARIRLEARTTSEAIRKAREFRLL